MSEEPVTPTGGGDIVPELRMKVRHLEAALVTEKELGAERATAAAATEQLLKREIAALKEEVAAEKERADLASRTTRVDKTALEAMLAGGAAQAAQLMQTWGKIADAINTREDPRPATKGSAMGGSYASAAANEWPALETAAKTQAAEEKARLDSLRKDGFDMAKVEKYMGKGQTSTVASTFFVTGLGKTPGSTEVLQLLQSAPGYNNVFLDVSRIGSGQFGNGPYYQIWCMPEQRGRALAKVREMSFRVDEQYNPRTPGKARANDEVAKANALTSFARRMKYVRNLRDCRQEVRNAIDQDAQENGWSHLLVTANRVIINHSPTRGRKKKKVKPPGTQKEAGKRDEEETEKLSAAAGKRDEEETGSTAEKTTEEAEEREEDDPFKTVTVDNRRGVGPRPEPEDGADRKQKRRSAPIKWYEIMEEELMPIESKEEDGDYCPPSSDSDTGSDLSSDDAMDESMDWGLEDGPAKEATATGGKIIC